MLNNFTTSPNNDHQYILVVYPWNIARARARALVVKVGILSSYGDKIVIQGLFPLRATAFNRGKIDKGNILRESTLGGSKRPPLL